jgi:excisionase family DNA binding protein
MKPTNHAQIPPPPKMLRAGPAAERLGVTTQTLRNYTAQGVLTLIETPGRQRRYLEAEIDALVELYGTGRQHTA